VIFHRPAQLKNVNEKVKVATRCHHRVQKFFLARNREYLPPNAPGLPLAMQACVPILSTPAEPKKKIEEDRDQGL
jgi:hypothetical protein